MMLPSTRSCARRWLSGRRARARTTLSLLTGTANPSSSPCATCWRQGRSMRWTPTPTLTAWARTDSRMAPTLARPSTLASLPWALARTPALNAWALRTMTSWPMTSRSRALAVVGAGSRAACWMARKRLTGRLRGRRWRTTSPGSCRRATPRQHGDFCRARSRTPWPWTRGKLDPTQPNLPLCRRFASASCAELLGGLPPCCKRNVLGSWTSTMRRANSHIADACPDLGDLLQYLAYLQRAAEAEETRANQAAWKAGKRKSRLTSRDCRVGSRPPWLNARCQWPTDPQTKAEQAAKVWGQIWHRDGQPDGLRLRDLLARLHLPRAVAPEVQVSGEVLHRRAKASARKAAGSDDWSGRLWRGLDPEGRSYPSRLAPGPRLFDPQGGGWAATFGHCCACLEVGRYCSGATVSRLDHGRLPSGLVWRPSWTLR